jgi:alkylation response protein AidB-like acyl-CoA dehydrogenase
MAGIFLVMANVDPSKGYKGITCFVVDKEMGKPFVEVGAYAIPLIDDKSRCFLEECRSHDLRSSERR